MHEDVNNSFVEIKTIEEVLNTFDTIDDVIKNDIVDQLIQKSISLDKLNINNYENELNSEINDSEIDTDIKPKIKKQWAILVSDPLQKISGEYMGWVFQMNDDENIAELNSKIIDAAKNFNSSKKGSKIPVKTIGECIMNVPNKFFKEQKIYVKTKEPVFINITNNSLQNK